MLKLLEKMLFTWLFISQLAAGGRPIGDSDENFIKHLCSKCVLYDTDADMIFDYDLPGSSNISPTNGSIAGGFDSSYLSMLVNTIHIPLHKEEFMRTDQLHIYSINMINIFVSLFCVILCVVNISTTIILYRSRYNKESHGSLTLNPVNQDIEDDTYSSSDNWL